MGSHFKVYLTDVEDQGLTLLQAKVREDGGNGAANALFKDALRAMMIDQGVLEYAPGMGPGQPALLRVVPPKVEPQPEVEPVRAVRRRRRASRD